MRQLPIALLILPFLAAPAFGWGCQGHEMVALIARAHLTPAASAAIDKLLAENKIDATVRVYCTESPADAMAVTSTWADDVRRRDRKALWHFVDIPLGVPHKDSDIGASIAEWCPPIDMAATGKDLPGCVANAIVYELGLLRDSARPAAERADALRYVIHFVGDIHMPLHDSDNKDQGGNCTAITFLFEPSPTNLHSIWDYKLIEHDFALTKTGVSAYAQMLDRRFAPKWELWGKEPVDPVAWSWEGHGLSVKPVYAALRPGIPLEGATGPTDCDAERKKVAELRIVAGEPYFDETIPVIQERLARAGYRLASLLNGMF